MKRFDRSQGGFASGCIEGVLTVFCGFLKGGWNFYHFIGRYLQAQMGDPKLQASRSSSKTVVPVPAL